MKVCAMSCVIGIVRISNHSPWKYYESNALPGPERAREQEHGCKAEDVRRLLWHGSASSAQ